MSLVFSKKYFLIIILILLNNCSLRTYHCGLFWGDTGETNTGDKPVKYVEKCYDNLGCVKLTPDWTHYLYRPHNVLPSDRHAINTIFIRWSLRLDRLVPYVIGTADLKYSGVGGKLKLLVHDFTSNGYAKWIQHLAKGLITCRECGDTSVVSVDWAAGAEPPYTQAVANARLVAMEIVLFLSALEDMGVVDNKSVHIIGHGVGAHVAGYVGKMVRLARITALDPAGPYFKGMPPNVKLHKGDASFVEVLHTSSPFCQGNDEITGHVDFFANGGMAQPLCEEPSTTKITKLRRDHLKLGQIYPGCSHKRSVKYYIDTLHNPQCVYIGLACASYKDFLQGKCLSCGTNNELCFRMHPCSRPKPLNNTKGFYFLTSGSSPFCTEMLRVSLELVNDVSCGIKGVFNVTVKQKNGDMYFLINENGDKMFGQENTRGHRLFSFIVLRSVPPMLQLPAKAVHVSWKDKHIIHKCNHAPKISSIALQVISDIENNLKQVFYSGSRVESLGGVGVGMVPASHAASKMTNATHDNNTKEESETST